MIPTTSCALSLSTIPPADGTRVAAELPLPESKAKDGNTIAGHAAIGRRQCTSAQRLHAEHLEEVRRHVETACAHRVALPPERYGNYRYRAKSSNTVDSR